MRKKGSTRWIVSTVVAFFILFPFLLNWVLGKKAIIPVVGDSSTWLSFWPVYLSAFASFGMIYMTYLSLAQSKDQLEDLKKRDAEERRARLVFSVIVYQSAFYLRIFNIGKENAYNVKLNINDDFIDEIKDSYREFYRKLSKPDFIEGGKSIYILIGWCEDVDKEWEGKNIILSVKGTYNDQYTVDETLDMGYFIGKTHFMVKGDLETTMEHIKKGLVVQNSIYKPVQITLENIAHTMRKIDYSLMELLSQVGKPADVKEAGGDIKEPNEGRILEESRTDNIPVMRD